MEFWGVELEAGKSLKCEPEAGKFIHISQAVVEVKNDKANNVVLSVMIGGKKLVIGILTQKTTHILFDLVFEKEFELSHNGKSSVHVCGYTYFIKEGPDECNDESEEESEDDSDVVPELIPAAKLNAATIKQKVNASKNETKPTAEGNLSYLEAEVSDDDDESEDLSDSDKDMNGFSDDTDECEDESSEEEKTTLKVNVNKKRPASSASKTPVPEKKAKLVTPAWQKSGTEKKFVHTATPYPIKQAGKTPAASKSHQPIPITGSQSSCKSCNKTFTSDHALESRTKAKHSFGK